MTSSGFRRLMATISLAACVRLVCGRRAEKNMIAVADAMRGASQRSAARICRGAGRAFRPFSLRTESEGMERQAAPLKVRTLRRGRLLRTGAHRSALHRGDFA